MIMPSSVSVTSAPIALRFSATRAIRLDSLTFNSAASLMTVRPWAKQAMRATVGSSSIMAGMTEPWITVPWRLLERTSRSAVGSEPLWSWFIRVRSAPMALQTVRRPARVGLIPAFLMSTSELGRIIPAAAKYTAEEISPGTVIRFP